jgi:hypothetical protein
MMTTTAASAGTRDFDFLWGTWEIHNARLASRLTGSNEWERFTAHGECWPILGGAGNVDTFSTRQNGQDFEGASLRVYNPATQQWAIYWADNVNGRLLPPVFGQFVDRVGEFVGEDQHEGRPVMVRFRWTDITADSARWEQAFSEDHGATWEVNWIMSFRRTDT